MATTQSWSSETQPDLGIPFSGGDASSWCVHTPPSWARRLVVVNTGTGELRVSYPAQSGSYEASDRYQPIPAGGSLDIALRGPSFATIGAEGATHPMRITFLRRGDP